MEENIEVLNLDKKELEIKLENFERDVEKLKVDLKEKEELEHKFREEKDTFDKHIDKINKDRALLERKN